MIKKVISLLVVSILLIINVSAWEYENSNSYGTAKAQVRIEGTYPICDGEQLNGACKGLYYVELDFEGDDFYLEERVSDWPKATKYGFSGLNRVTPGRYYFDEGAVPKFVICAFDYDTGPNGDWAWTYKCGGYKGDYNFNSLITVECMPDETFCQGANYFTCNHDTGKFLDNGIIKGECEVECLPGEEACSLSGTLTTCESYRFTDKGPVLNKCGVECITGADCPHDITGLPECFRTNVYANADVAVCTSDYTCSEEKIKLEHCILGCSNGSCILQPNKTVPILIIVGFSLLIVGIMFIGLKRRKGSKRRR